VIGEAEELPRDSLVDFWLRLAKEFKGFSEEVAFGIMNEPYDVKQEVWFGTLQAVVTAIRNSGATNRILLPAENWSHLESFSTSYHAGMSQILNPDGSCTGLIFEIHEVRYHSSSGTRLFGKPCEHR
jgi:endoglucanase